MTGKMPSLPDINFEDDFLIKEEEGFIQPISDMQEEDGQDVFIPAPDYIAEESSYTEEYAFEDTTEEEEDIPGFETEVFDKETTQKPNIKKIGIVLGITSIILIVILFILPTLFGKSKKESHKNTKHTVEQSETSNVNIDVDGFEVTLSNEEEIDGVVQVVRKNKDNFIILCETEETTAGTEKTIELYCSSDDIENTDIETVQFIKK